MHALNRLPCIALVYQVLGQLHCCSTYIQDGPSMSASHWHLVFCADGRSDVVSGVKVVSKQQHPVCGDKMHSVVCMEYDWLNLTGADPWVSLCCVCM